MPRWVIDAAALALILAAMLGCGSSSNSGAPDASTNMDGSADGGTTDTPVEAGPDCGSMPPTGTQVVASTDPAVILTMTGDDQVVYEDLTTQEIYGVAAAGGGGKPSDIGKMLSQATAVWAHGNTLLYLPTAASESSAYAPISAWTAANGTSVISKSAVAWDSYLNTYDASKDGQYVVYFATTDGLTATLTVSTIDGKTQTPLVPGIDLTGQGMTGTFGPLCWPPMVQFVDDTVVAQYCLPRVATADAGTPAETATIATFTAPSFAPVTFATTFQPPSGSLPVDPTGKTVLLLDPSGTGLSLYPLSGASPVTVDATGVAGLFTATGDLLYLTTGGSLVRYTAGSGTTTTLVPNGVAAAFDVSPDGTWLQAASQQNATTGLTDLLLASTTTPGPANHVVKTETVQPAGFTADSQFSLIAGNFPPNFHFGVVNFDLEASKTSGGAASKVLTVAGALVPTTGSKVVCNTNYSPSTGGADIVSIDLSTTAPPTTLVTQANQHVFGTSTKKIAYSWSCNENAMAGIWVLTPP
jgi:hypothetical protein